MSFLFFISQPTHKKNFLGHLFRKEEDSTKTQLTSPYFPKGIERASLFASFRGSVCNSDFLFCGLLSLLSGGNYVCAVVCPFRPA